MSSDEAGKHGVHLAVHGPVHDRRRQAAVPPLFALAAYCLAYLAIRLAIQGGLDRDEAEIVYLAQQLRLGYGTQPPLYTWLQWLSFEAFGVNWLGLLLPKALALAATCIALFHAARSLAGRGVALAVCASLALFPQVAWETLRSQTHSVLATAIAAATLWLYFALLRRPSLTRYLAFGVLCGLGLQAKYNCGAFLAAIAGASLLVPEHRMVLWNRRVLAAALPALLLLLPHAAWVARNPALAFGGTVRKMRDGSGHGAYLERVGDGMLAVLGGTIAFIALAALIYMIVCWRRLGRDGMGRVRFDVPAPAGRFFAAFYGICLLLLAALALTGEIGTFKQRWLIPLLFFLPLGVFVMFPALGREDVVADIRRVAMGAALCLLALLPLRLWLGPAAGRIMAQHVPHAQLAAEVRRHCPQAHTIVTDSLSLAGNLRFIRPEARTVLLEDAQREPTSPDAPARAVALVAHADATAQSLAAFHAMHPRLVLGRRVATSLALEDGSGRRLDFVIACDRP